MTQSAENTTTTPLKIGVLTSGGDAQGMNAAVRAVVRTAISQGAEVYAIFEGYQGMIDADEEKNTGIRRFSWDDAGAILGRGGTVIGTYRSKEFRTREGRLKAATNLLKRGIDRLVVIGGDGSLTGLNTFRDEWPSLLEELVSTGTVSQELADEHPVLMIAGLVGSIDNDLVGVDSTIGADSAMHRIVDAIDAITSTAASHQRSFVVEVMGRHCGYLALMSAIAAGCDYVLIPEFPPADGWEDEMCATLRRGRSRGRRDSLVVVAEGAQDQHGNRITADYVREVIADRLQEDARVTILGHVQRGGDPSAYDRWASTWLGHEAAKEVLNADQTTEPVVIGIRGNSVVRVPLMKAVGETQGVATLIDEGKYDEAMAARGGSFNDMVDIFRELAFPEHVDPTPDAKRIAIVHAGGLAPGMNTAARAAVRLGINRGFRMLGVEDGFVGLQHGEIRELDWDNVEGWTREGGAHLGLRRNIPTMEDLYGISRSLEDNKIDGLLVIGGWNAYQAAHLLHSERDRYPAFKMPIVCVPASIDNNLPGTELSIGSDTALNINVKSIDMVKMSGAATTRCFVVETMGRYCGFLALMSGVAGGAERVYLNEEGIRLADLAEDVEWLQNSFRSGRKFFLAVRNERASEAYTTDFLAQMLRGESHGLFDVRASIIGHIQQGGAPSPSDRLLATRLVSHALTTMEEELANGRGRSWYIGLKDSQIVSSSLAYMNDEMDSVHRRPIDQWWLKLRDVQRAVSESKDSVALR